MNLERSCEVAVVGAGLAGLRAVTALAEGRRRRCRRGGAGGAEGGYWTQGIWTAYGPALRAPIGPLHWAGTETSLVWCGKMEGAVRSGERVAAEVLEALGPSEPGRVFTSHDRPTAGRVS